MNWSKCGFLVLLWSFFHLFTFLKSKQFQSEPAHFFVDKWKFIEKWAIPWPTHSEKTKKICSWKKSFLKKCFFLFLLWTSKLFWWKVWILCCIWQANLIAQAYIPNSVAAFFSRFRKFQNDCSLIFHEGLFDYTNWLIEYFNWAPDLQASYFSSKRVKGAPKIFTSIKNRDRTTQQ